MSTSAHPLRKRPPVLSHRDVILNIIIWSTTSSQLSHRGEGYTHHMAQPTTGGRLNSPEENDAPTIGGQLNSHTEENDAPSRGYAQHWAPSQVDSTQS